MPGKPKRPGGHGYGRRSKKCIGRRFKSSQKKAVAVESATTHKEVRKHLDYCVI